MIDREIMLCLRISIWVFEPEDHVYVKFTVTNMSKSDAYRIISYPKSAIVAILLF